MKISDLQRFVALVDEDVHFPRAAEALGIPLPSLYSSMDKLEEEVGHPLLTNTKNGPILSPAGTLLLEEAKRQIAAAPAPADKPKVPAGGKAKASKGKGRGKVLKGQPKPYKKRQGR
ncbi:LysR family transcriptional regulator [Microbacterium sp. P5_E9]